MNKIVVVGIGNVGLAYSYAIINSELNIDELILIDINEKRALGNAMDLSHASVFSKSKINVKKGDYSDCKDAKIVVICAGYNQKDNETRLDLINKNCKIMKEIVLNTVSNGFNGIFLVATNPVDIMTYVTRKYSNFSSSKVIGSGTVLDTARLRYLLSEKLQINPNNIHAYVIGEHGDSEFVIWSKAEAGVVPINKILPSNDLEVIEHETKVLAYRIIDCKGETSYGIGSSLARITRAILNNEEIVLTVSAPVDDIYIGMPAVINKNGVKGVMKISLSKEEKEKLENSKNIIKNAMNNMEV